MDAIPEYISICGAILITFYSVQLRTTTQTQSHRGHCINQQNLRGQGHTEGKDIRTGYNNETSDTWWE